MRHKAYSLTPLLAGVVIAVVVGLAMQARLAPRGELAASTAQPDGRAGEAPPEAAKIIRQAAEAMEALPAVSAMVRQQVDLKGQRFHGVGQYWQQKYAAPPVAAGTAARPAAACRFRLEFKYQVEDRTASLLVIGNDQAVWNYSKLLNEDDGYSVLLTRLDVPRVLAAKAKGSEPKPDGYGFKIWGVGGLSQVLEALSVMYDFEQILPVQLGGVPLWEVRGELNKTLLATLLYEQQEAIAAGTGFDYSKLPPLVPDQAVVYLGRDDLFPYRLVYAKRDEGELREAVVIEYYEVDFSPQLEDQQFQFDPGTKKYTDRTKEYIDQRGVKDKK